jgi:FHS family L-fucose permease-like MFS transporter
MAFQASETHSNADIKPFRKQYRLFHAAFAQFCYTGAQVAIASYFINYVTETRANTSSSLAAKFLAGAQGYVYLHVFSSPIFQTRKSTVFVSGIFIVEALEDSRG